MATAKPKTKRIVYSRFNRQRVRTPGGSGNGAKQSFKDECDINNIMAKYQKTGAIDHFSKHAPRYEFASSNDFAESMRIVTKAQEMFAELPSSIRSKFNNEPEQFLEFVQNPDNLSEMETLGLTTKRPESTDSGPPGTPEGDPEPPAGDPPTG